MLPACSGIAPEGLPFILITGLAAIVFAVLKWPLIAVVCLLLSIFCVNFFRDPERVVPDAKNVAVSPADGQIVKIAKHKDPIANEEHCCISIFMNVFNVHVNRVPVDCEVTNLRYFPGKFFNASLDKASIHNERCAWQLKESTGEIWCMVQIAGLIARRIVCRAQKGDRLKRGERCGMIRFGSRVDVYLPDNYTPTIKIGDHVIAGQTIIANKSDEQ